MSECPTPHVDDVEFDFCPEQPLSAEQRVELLELQVIELRRQLDALVDQVGSLSASPVT